MNIPRLIWLKYPSHCVVCDRAMAKGDKALWQPGTKLVAHEWHFGEEEKKTPNLLDKIARR